ncbi:MAG: hypothetical protein HDR12_14695 [Lachnospiraceae bacterium]|nr:hypothetical protein [Lachnospiraceae bacterium]
MDILENKLIIIKKRCNALGKFLSILFWVYLILSLMALIYCGVRALVTPESSFIVEQYGSDAKVGFNIGGKGLYLLVTNTSFHMGEYSCKVLFGIVWLITLGYQALSAAILWCMASIFHHIKLDESPFTLFCSHLVRDIGLLLLCVFVYKNVVEAAILFIFGPSTARSQLICKLELALIGGIVLCLGYIFEYGLVLQQQSDETL